MGRDERNAFHASECRLAEYQRIVTRQAEKADDGESNPGCCTENVFRKRGLHAELTANATGMLPEVVLRTPVVAVYDRRTVQSPRKSGARPAVADRHSLKRL